MKKLIPFIFACLILFSISTSAQEVVIADFPLGVGGSVNRELFRPYYDDLKALSDTLQKYPKAMAIITGGSDGEEYAHNHDANNPGLALGRAHTLRDFMASEFDIAPARMIVQSQESGWKGGDYRFAAVRITTELSELESRLAKLENRPPVEKHFTEIRDVVAAPDELLGLHFGAGLSSSPFGGIPIVAGSVSWKRIVFIEGVAGHTFWDGTFRFEGVDLDTKRRMIGGQVIVYPSNRILVGIVGGWMRIEEISQEYYEYVKLSDGPVLGLRALPFEFLSVTGVYNPSKHRVAGDVRSESKNGQFLISITAHIGFGGAK